MSHHHPFKILFVSDNAESLKFTEEILKQTDLGGFELEPISIEDDLLRIVPNTYDVCIVDCSRSGLLMIAELRRHSFTAPIIVLTSNSAAEVLDAIHQGASDCIVRDNLTPRALEQSICATIDRAQNLESQAQYERCYLGLMENATEIIYTHDLQGNFTSINKTGECVLGYSSAEILEMNFRQVIAPQYVLAVWRTVSQMLSSRKPSTFGATVMTKEGGNVQVEFNIHLLYKAGTPIGVQGVARTTWALPSIFAAGAERASSA